MLPAAAAAKARGATHARRSTLSETVPWSRDVMKPLPQIASNDDAGVGTEHPFRSSDAPPTSPKSRLIFLPLSLTSTLLA